MSSSVTMCVDKNFSIFLYFQIFNSLHLAFGFKFPGLDAQSAIEVVKSVTFKKCNQVIHNDLPARDSEVLNLVAKGDGSPKVILIANQSAVVGKDVWGNRTTCELHLILTPVEALVSTSAALIKQFQINRAQEFQFFLVLALNSLTPNMTTTFGENLENELGTGGPAAIEALKRMQNWAFLLLTQQPNNELTILEHSALCLFCKPDLLYCSCAINQALVTFEKSRTFEGLDYNGWPIMVYPNYEVPTLDDWSSISALRLRTILSKDWKNYTIPLYKFITILASKLNATIRSLSKEENRKPYNWVIYTRWSKYNPEFAKLFVDTEGTRFFYCKNKTDSVGNGDLRILLAPFDPITWFCIAACIVGMCGIFKLSRGNTNLFHILACLVCQGHTVSGKFVFLWVLWIFANLGLTNLYTSFIESIMVAPSAQRYLESFEELYRADYHIVMGAKEPMAGNLRNGLLSGTWYLKALSENTEFVGNNYWDPEFIRNAFQKGGKRRAILIAGSQSIYIRYAFRIKLPWLDCHVSEAEIPISWKTWAATNPNAPYVRGLIHRLYSVGILGFFMKGREVRWNRRFVLASFTVLDKVFYPKLRRGPVTPKDNDGAHGGHTLSTENSQAGTIFFTWLVTLGSAGMVFAVEWIVANCACLF